MEVTGSFPVLLYHNLINISYVHRKVNFVTKTETFPIPRIDDCIDNIGHAKFDLLKGFWHIPLSHRVKEVSAVMTPDGLRQYKDLPYRMKNSPATFQRSVNRKACIDDAIIFSNEWEQHLKLSKHPMTD